MIFVISLDKELHFSSLSIVFDVLCNSKIHIKGQTLKTDQDMFCLAAISH